jgi:hypothetical protein
MRARLLTVALGAAIAAVSQLPLNAHHSIAAQFHLDKTNTVSGTIAKMEFKNPHSWLYVDVKDAKGQVSQWSIEFGSANALYRRGWRREDLPVGAMVTVTGYVSRDGSQILGATDVKLADGRTLFAGSAPGR